jgi:hypothetical protein
VPAGIIVCLSVCLHLCQHIHLALCIHTRASNQLQIKTLGRICICTEHGLSFSYHYGRNGTVILSNLQMI